MPAVPELALACKVCGWRPGEDQEMQVVKDHFDDLHPDAEGLELELVGFCPRDDALLKVRMTGNLRSGRAVTTYDCPTCMRTYQVTWDGKAKQ